MGGNQVVKNKPGGNNSFFDQHSWRTLASRRSTWLHSRRSGQELVEFAVVLPFLLIVLIGVIDLGRVFHASITIANASRAGARYAISYGYNDTGGVVTVDSGATTTRAQNEAQNSGIALDSVNVNCPGGCAHGGQVIVTVTHNFQFLFNAFMGSGLTLSHSTAMKIPW